jgi:hypothetical protein
MTEHINFSYRELYSDKAQKDFSESVRCYEKAALLMPASGNPHNQVLMTQDLWMFTLVVSLIACYACNVQ